LILLAFDLSFYVKQYLFSCFITTGNGLFVKDAFVKIARNEGITALWSGLPPSL